MNASGEAYTIMGMILGTAKQYGYPFHPTTNTESTGLLFWALPNSTDITSILVLQTPSTQAVAVNIQKEVEPAVVFGCTKE